MSPAVCPRCDRPAAVFRRAPWPTEFLPALVCVDCATELAEFADAMRKLHTYRPVDWGAGTDFAEGP